MGPVTPIAVDKKTGSPEPHSVRLIRKKFKRLSNFQKILENRFQSLESIGQKDKQGTAKSLPSETSRLCFIRHSGKQPENVPDVADPHSNDPQRINILLGAEFYHQLLTEGQIRPTTYRLFKTLCLVG